MEPTLTTFLVLLEDITTIFPTTLVSPASCSTLDGSNLELDLVSLMSLSNSKQTDKCLRPELEGQEEKGCLSLGPLAPAITGLNQVAAFCRARHPEHVSSLLGFAPGL